MKLPELRMPSVPMTVTFLFLFLGVLPALRLGNIAIPLQYCLLPLVLFYLLFMLFGWIKTPALIKVFLFMCSIIIGEVVLSSTFGPLIKIENFVIPSDSVQYVLRFAVLLIFVSIFFNHAVNTGRFLLVFLIMLSVAMVIGVIQFLPWAGAPVIASLYASKDLFVDLSAGDLLFKRVSGIAGHPTANGGIAAFTFVTAFSIYLFFGKYRKLCIIAMLLAALNTIASQARMGYVTIVFSMVVFCAVWIRVKQELIKPALMLLMAFLILMGAVVFLYQNSNSFLMQAATRWLTLADQLGEGGNRIGQISYALSKLRDPYDYLLGISRGVQLSYGDGRHGMLVEVEPVYILILYGILGCVLQYSFIAMLLVYFWNKMGRLRSEPGLLTMTVASFVGLLSYVFFSLAYYFFREIRVPLFPWILMGACAGAVERCQLITWKGQRTVAAAAVAQATPQSQSP